MPTVVLCTVQRTLTARDVALIDSLKAGPLAGEPDVLADLEAMATFGRTVESEGLLTLPGGGTWFSKRLGADMEGLVELRIVCQGERHGPDPCTPHSREICW